MTRLHYLIKSHYYSRENTVLGRQRLIFFESAALLALALIISGLIIHPNGPIIVTVGIIVAIATAVLLVLYHRHYLSIRWASTILYIMLQVHLSFAKVSYAVLEVPDSSSLIIQASFLSLLLIMLSIVSYLKYSPTIISGISIFTYLTCILISPTPVLMDFLPVYIVVLVGVIVYDNFAVKSVMRLDASNQEIQHEVYEFMQTTGLTLGDLRSISQLSKGNADKTERTRNLLSMMDTRVRKNIVDSVLAVKSENESARDIIMAALPNLTPSQISICQLVLQGKKLSEICKIMGKSETNISSQRSRIRGALGLGPEDNLKDALEEKVRIYLAVRGGEKR